MTDTMKRLAVLLIGTLFVLCVAIVLAVSLPVSTAFAAETETATDTESEATVHDHADGTWTELTADGGTLQSGNYYLAGDVKLTTDITIADNTTVVLCLNGYKLTGTGTDSVITVSDDASFTLTDCRSASEEAEYQHSYYVAESGLWTFYDGDLPEAAPDGAETGVVTGGVITGGNGLYGGVYADGGTFTMDGGTISGNTAAVNGGGVFIDKYAAFTMGNGTISGNTAEYGGGVFVHDSEFTMNDGTISGNTAASGGGVNVDSSTFTMTGGTISGNTATVGGGVFVFDDTFTMSGGTISGNTAEYGGGVCEQRGTFTMTGGTISGNTANYGGGVYLYGGVTFAMQGGYFGGEIENSGTVSISGGYFAEEFNEAYLAEKCVLQDVSALGGATFDGDYKDGFPYAVYKLDEQFTASAKGDIIYDGSPVEEGTDFTVTGADGMTLGYMYKQEGGEYAAGLPAETGEYTIFAYVFDSETKTFVGTEFALRIFGEIGARTVFEGQTYNYETVAEAFGALGEFSTSGENRAVVTVCADQTVTQTLALEGGFVTLDLNGYIIKMTGSGSVIQINGGADLILTDGSVDVTHNYYIADGGLWVFYEGELPADAPENAETGTVTGGVITGGNGLYGGVYADGGTFTMDGGTISGNTAEYGGGGVYADGGTFTMDGGTISGNTAEYGGGGVYVSGGTFTMNSGTISGNTAADGGGVCVAWSGTFTMTDGIISGNTAEYGGGVYVSGRTFTMEGGTISGNTASKDGGGVYMDGTFTMKDGAITNNIASNNNKRGGGGVFVGGTFTMEGGTISGNTATNGSGGGVNVYNSSDSMFNMTGGYLGDNTATESGNDIYKDEAGVVSISGGYFSENPDAAYIADGHTAQDISALGGATFDGDYKDGFPYAVYAQGGILISTNKDIVYDGSPVAEGVDFTVEGTDGVTLTYSYKVESDDEFTAGLPTNAGDYTVYAYALNGEKQFISMVFDITIAKATYDMSGITFADDRVTYDGEAHSIEIAGTLPGGVSVSYDVSYKVNAGEYTVTATFTGDSANYNAIPDMTAKLTIAKAVYDMSDITFEDGSFTYDGQAHSLAISGTLPDGVTVTYEGNGKVNAGEYTVTATFTGDSANYNAIPDMTAKLTIAKAVYDMSDITFEDGSFTYDGQAHSLVISGTLPTGVSVTYAGNDKTNAGEYTVTATFVGDYDNYIAIPDITATLTIAKAAPAYTAPTDLTVVAEGTLADIALPDGWAWKDGTVRLTETGEYKAVAVYTAADTANYNPVEVELTITVLEPEGLSGGAIAGIVIGSVFGALILAYAICAILYKKKLVKGAFFAKIYPFIKD